MTQALPSDPTGTNPTTLTYNFSSFTGAEFGMLAIQVDVSPAANVKGDNTLLNAIVTGGTPLADLSVTKTGTPTVTAGTNATYTVTVNVLAKERKASS